MNKDEYGCEGESGIERRNIEHCWNPTAYRMTNAMFGTDLSRTFSPRVT